MTDATKLVPIIEDADLRRRIESVDNLPTLPDIYNELVAEMSSPDFSIKRIAAIVSRDVALSAKVLQVVNSAYFGLSNEVHNVQQAVSYLGADTVKGIVLSASVFGSAETDGRIGNTPAELYSRGVAVGTKARFVAYSMGLGGISIDNALTAGMLHEVGKLVLIVHFWEEYAAAVKRSRQESIPLYTCQEQTIGANDAVIGAHLLSTWGLAKGLVDAVELHYKPSRSAQRELNEVTAVHLAYASEHDENHDITERENSAFDYDYLDSLGIADQVQSFRSLSADSLAGWN